MIFIEEQCLAAFIYGGPSSEDQLFFLLTHASMVVFDKEHFAK